MIREMYCLRCPRGCLLLVEGEKEHFYVKGHACRLGEQFAIQEIRDPRRSFTSSIRVRGGKFPLVSVMTSEPIPRKDMVQWAELCRNLEANAPIEVGMVVAHSPFGDGIHLVTTWYVEEENHAINGG